VRLEQASPEPPPGVEELLADLGDGENGFGGTPVHGGAMTLAAFLQHCQAQRSAENLQPGLVPQTVFWVLDEHSRAVGMVRMRHYLNEHLLDHGGHVGYYIKPDQRGRGYGTAALGLALVELRKLGEDRVMLTVDLDNYASIRVIEANGGRLASIGTDERGRSFGRYWIEATDRTRISE
jgi:predicted acetyltransferase